MKLKKETIYAFVSLFLLFLIGCLISLIPNIRYYPSVEEAFRSDKIFRHTEYLGQIESNGVSEIFYSKKGTNVAVELLFYDNDTQQWKIQEPLNIVKKSKIINEHSFQYSEYNGKHIISILGSTAPNGGDKSTEDVADSISSEFQVFHYQDDEITSYHCYYWLLVLDELPEHYSVTVGGETIYLNE